MHKPKLWYELRPVDVRRAARGGRRRLRPCEAALGRWAERYAYYWRSSDGSERAHQMKHRIWSSRRTKWKWFAGWGSTLRRRKFARTPYEKPFKRGRVITAS